ncbi:MAG: hypothetical protein N3B21_03370 [Clostridia bacterium]|nr:hypothetical protein [Clostridia bacterium]
MKRKILVLILAVVFLFSQLGEVYAKGSRGSSGSSRSSSFSRSSGGYSGSSSSKKSGGLFGSSSSSSSKSSSSGGYSGSSSSKKSSSSESSSRGVSESYSSGKSYSGSSTSKSSSGFFGSKSKTETQKKTYMQDTYKKEASKYNYSAYKQKLNSEQKKVYESSFSNSYKMNNRMSFEDAIKTRPQRITVYSHRPVIVKVKHKKHFDLDFDDFSYGYGFVGPWDLWFLMRASDLFWYHHWNDIYPYRDYFEDDQFRQMEARVRALEQQGIQRDPSYLDPDVDPDLQFSSEYQERNLDSIYYTNKYPPRSGNPLVTIFVISIIVVILIIIIRKLSRPKRPKEGSYSRIY